MENQNVCEFCKRSFQTSYFKKKHKLLKHDYCQDCEKKFDTNEELVNHFVKYHPKSCFTCKKCPEVFLSKPRLVNHRKFIHEGIPRAKRRVPIYIRTYKYPCEICDYAFESKNALKEHQNAKHAMVKNFECDKCDFKTAWKSELKKHHEVIHENRIWKLYHCTSCDYNTKYKKHLTRHEKQKHVHADFREKFKCELCGKEYLSSRGLSHHIETNHSNESKYKCTICDFETKWKNSFVVHMKYHSTDESDKLQCQDCTFSTHWKGVLATHIKRSHTSTSYKNVRCDICDKSFKSTFEYREHNRARHKGKCNFCDYSTKCLDTMKVHLKNCGKNVKKYKCDNCDFKISNKMMLSKHKSKVHGKEVKCEYCDFSTENRTHIVKHMERCRKSTKEMFCEHCSKRFTIKSCLSMHIYYKHKDIEKETKCKHCDFSSATNHSLNNHMKECQKSTKEMFCEHCNKRFTLKKYLLFHIYSQHKKPHKTEEKDPETMVKIEKVIEFENDNKEQVMKTLKKKILLIQV